MQPDQLLFAKTHEWVAVSEDNGQKFATVGISAFAVEALTDLVFMELPAVGVDVEAEQAFCEVESVKAVSDVYAPVTGKVVEVNQSLPDELDKLSSSPYEEGWIAKIEISDESGLDQLMDYQTYQKQCAEEQ